MRKLSSTPGLYLTKTGWTGKASAITAGNEAIHAELARSDVRLMKGGLLAKRLGIKGRLINPFPNGHVTSAKAIQNMRFGLLEELSGDLDER